MRPVSGMAVLPLPGGESIEGRGPGLFSDALAPNPLTLPFPRRGEE